MKVSVNRLESTIVETCANTQLSQAKLVIWNTAIGSLSLITLASMPLQNEHNVENKLVRKSVLGHNSQESTATDSIKYLSKSTKHYRELMLVFLTHLKLVYSKSHAHCIVIFSKAMQAQKEGTIYDRRSAGSTLTQ